MNKKRKLCMPHYTAGLLKRRDKAEIGMEKSKTTHEFCRHHETYWKIINRLKRLEG